jgi:NAD(P)-dependent dehydrogenase (short-subunit alcohol dehydrogenase family)
LGKGLVIEFVKHGATRVYFTGRNEKSAGGVIEAAKVNNATADVRFVRCDLAELASVKAAAKQIASETDRLDILMCNAGIMAVPPALTKDGYELQFGTNHLGHALLMRELLPILSKTAEEPNSDVRLISTTSQGMMFARSLPLDKMKTTLPSWLMGNWQRYGFSKVANLLYARELAKHHPEILSLSVHPGVIITDLVDGLPFANRMFVKATTYGQTTPVEQGHWQLLYMATAPKEQFTNGGYYEPIGVIGTQSALSKDDAVAKELYEWTEKELASY